MKFTDLKAWQKGMELVKEVYKITEAFPRSEQFALTSQLRKAAASILANLAEGFSRSTDADKAHKYTISRGECSETRALILIAVAVGRLPESSSKKALELSEEVGRLLTGLIERFRP